MRSHTGKQQLKRHLINEEIKAAEVLLIDSQGSKVGVKPVSEALEIAAEAGLDLTLIAPDSSPPVCRLMDYGKHVFAQRKKQKSNSQRRRSGGDIKEIKFRLGTESGDYNFKVQRLREFLEKGHKAKVTLRFRGREITRSEFGMKLLERVEQDLADTGVVEQRPVQEGRQLMMRFTPKPGIAGRAREAAKEAARESAKEVQTDNTDNKDSKQNKAEGKEETKQKTASKAKVAKEAKAVENTQSQAVSSAS